MLWGCCPTCSHHVLMANLGYWRLICNVLVGTSAVRWRTAAFIRQKQQI